MSTVRNILILLVALSLLGCISAVRPVSRTEYGRNDFLGRKGPDTTAQYVQGEAGARFETESPLTVDVLSGTQAVWADDGDVLYGPNINPRVFWFFDESTYLHAEVDATLLDGETNVFLFAAIERIW